MSIFYPEDLVIYGLSINSFIPFNVQDDVLAKVRKNYFEHNRRQNDKLVQNVQDVTIKYTYNLEKNKAMKWVVQKNKKTMEDSVIVSVNSYEIRTYNDNGEKICWAEYSNDHILKQVTFTMDSETAVISSGKENGSSVLYIRNKGVDTTLRMLQINESELVKNRLREKNPYISVTALTNLGLVYFGTPEEIENVQNVLKEIKNEILSEKTPKVYITQEDKESGFNFKDNDFNLKRNMNETYDIDKVEYFSFEEEINKDNSLEEENKEDIIEELSAETLESVDSQVAENISEEVLENSVEEIKEALEETTTEPTEENCEEIPVDAFEETLEEIPSIEQTDIMTDEETEDIEPTEISVEKTSATTDEIKDNLDNDLILKQVIEAMLEGGAKQQLETEGESPIRFASATSQENNQKDADLIINSGGEKYLYFGDVNDELQRDGYGRTEMSNGKTAYEGNYSHNKRNGFGSFYYKDGGLCYTGDWKDNKRDGFGLGIRSSDGSFHAGGWLDNKPEGVGVRFDKYGKFSYATNFKNGKENGLCVEFNDDGSLTIFRWENDSKKIIQRIYP